MKPEAQYFYIITFDTQIFELKYTEDKLNSAVKAWQNGELLIFKELGGGIHASSISKILNEELYGSYTFNVKPKLYIKDGTWYDGHERKFVRREKWKQDELDRNIKIDESTETVSEEEKQEVEKIRQDIRNKFATECQ